MKQLTHWLAAPFLVLLLVGCNTLEPIQTAETPEQKAFALYADYVIYKEIGADLAEDPDTPDQFVLALAAAVQVGDPAAELLREVADQVTIARARLRAIPNQETEDELIVALQVFNENWVDAQPKLFAVIDAVKEAL